MKKSIFNDVLGPVMRGPSSSHTAASYRIGAIARSMLKGELKYVRFLFDRNGSYGEVFRQQGSDLAFATGAMGWDITDERFKDVFEIASKEGKEINFEVGHIPDSDHPNEVLVTMKSTNEDHLVLRARSIGGGSVVITEVEGWPVDIQGDSYDLLFISPKNDKDKILEEVGKISDLEYISSTNKNNDLTHVHISFQNEPKKGFEKQLKENLAADNIRLTCPVTFICSGKELFKSAGELLSIAEKNNKHLWEMALDYESEMLQMPKNKVWKEMSRRLDIMERAVKSGISDNPGKMKLLNPTAALIYRSEKNKVLPVGGVHAKTMALALGVMHVNGAMGIVCAAPTAGSAGVIPGVLFGLAEEWNLSRDILVKALFTASAIGLIVAIRATFAAEVAGCQAEIGVAGAMASAAVVEMTGGSPEKALEAAGVYLQNNLGLICDPVKGFVEIPCHSRNGAAASGALTCADMIIGGYCDPIPFDETVDAMYSVGKMLPRELRSTALGGLAACPSVSDLCQKN